MKFHSSINFWFWKASIILLSQSFAFAQQTTPNLINLSYINYNPAITGIHEGIDVLFVNHQDFQFQSRLAQASIFLPKTRLSTGILVESYQSLLQSQTQIKFNLSYRIKIKGGFLQFGMAPALHNSRLHADNLKIKNPEDPSSTLQSYNLWGFNYNVGGLYKNNKLHLSLWVQNIGPHHYFTGNENSSLSLSRQFSGYSSYKFSLGEHWQYVPSVYYQNVKGTSFAAFANQVIFKSVFIAFQYGMYKFWTGSLGIYQSEIGKWGNLYLGYSLSSRSLGISTNLAHEIYLNFSFRNSGKTKAKVDDIPYYHSPVYF